MAYTKEVIDQKTEVSAPNETVESLASVQGRILEAVKERLSNFISGAIANRDYRDEDPTGIPSPEEDLEDLLNKLKPFCENLDAAAGKLARGELDLLPPNPLDHKLPDLQFTDYTQPTIRPISAHKQPS